MRLVARHAVTSLLAGVLLSVSPNSLLQPATAHVAPSTQLPSTLLSEGLLTKAVGDYSASNPRAKAKAEELAAANPEAAARGAAVKEQQAANKAKREEEVAALKAKLEATEAKKAAEAKARLEANRNKYK
jgi:hypothetical protein